MHQLYRLRITCLLAAATVAPTVVGSASPWPTDAALAQSAEVAPAQAAVLQTAYIFFFPNSARLNADAKDTLDELALSMKQFPASSLRITGYLMPGEPNLYQLSLRRAESVKAYLETRPGIDPARMACSGGIANQEQTDEHTIALLKMAGVAVLTLSED